MQVAMNEACSALSRAVDDMAHIYDAHWKEAPLYVIRDKVCLNGRKITTTSLMKKSDHKWLGLCSVDKIISQSAYQLKLPLSFGQTYPVFSITLPWPYNADTCHDLFLELSPTD